MVEEEWWESGESLVLVNKEVEKFCLYQREGAVGRAASRLNGPQNDIIFFQPNVHLTNTN